MEPTNLQRELDALQLLYWTWNELSCVSDLLLRQCREAQGLNFWAQRKSDAVEPPEKFLGRLHPDGPEEDEDSHRSSGDEQALYVSFLFKMAKQHGPHIRSFAQAWVAVCRELATLVPDRRQPAAPSLAGDHFALRRGRVIMAWLSGDLQPVFEMQRPPPLHGDRYPQLLVGPSLSGDSVPDESTLFAWWQSALQSIAKGLGEWAKATWHRLKHEEAQTGWKRLAAQGGAGEGAAQGAPSARRPGRPADTDAKADERIYTAWTTGHHGKYARLATELGISKRDVLLAIDRHRKRLKRRTG